MSEFDHLAPKYDDLFSHSSIGIAQRHLVRDYLKRAVKWPKERTLEIGCGTGEDALWLSDRTTAYHGFDQSNAMVEITQSKLKEKPSGAKNKIWQTSIEKWISPGSKREETYDFIFSNFGVLNCISPKTMSMLGAALSHYLLPGGDLVLVVMPCNCLWETAYFYYKGDRKSAQRRRSKGPVAAPILGGQVATWYYDPLMIAQALGPRFELIQTTPIGFALPPSFLQPYFNRNKKMLNILNKIDSKLVNISRLASMSDHFLLHCRLKSH